MAALLQPVARSGILIQAQPAATLHRPTVNGFKHRFNGDLRLMTAAYYVGKYTISPGGLEYSSLDVQGYNAHSDVTVQNDQVAAKSEATHPAWTFTLFSTRQLYPACPTPDRAAQATRGHVQDDTRRSIAKDI